MPKLNSDGNVDDRPSSGRRVDFFGFSLSRGHSAALVAAVFVLAGPAGGACLAFSHRRRHHPYIRTAPRFRNIHFLHTTSAAPTQPAVPHAGLLFVLALVMYTLRHRYCVRLSLGSTSGTTGAAGWGAGRNSNVMGVSDLPGPPPGSG